MVGSRLASALMFGGIAGSIALPGGAVLLLDPLGGTVLVPTSVSAGSNTIPLAIPASPTLVGRPLRVQAASIVNGGLTVSDGLRLTIL